MPTIKEIVKEYLEKNGYDGLLNDDCACLLNDLYPCGEIGNCQAGYKGACTCGEGCDWDVYSDKTAALAADAERAAAEKAG